MYSSHIHLWICLAQETSPGSYRLEYSALVLPITLCTLVMVVVVVVAAVVMTSQ